MKSQKLIKLFFLFVSITAIAASGCSKTDNVLGPNLGSGVTFQISQQTGLNGGTEFLFKPSANIKVSRIISKLDAQQFADTISYTNTNYVYSRDTTYIINEYTSVQNGQQWKFNFTGSFPGQNNSNYDVTSNYTVQ
ncbi:MAG: hypothetical protein L0Y79_11370 [Chlorobi bacterium]|nr:hypothetical protein [Chlorobiota bacterium]MCI0714745.1 hypothetical protein [Chlorobiota bacterium]